MEKLTRAFVEVEVELVVSTLYSEDEDPEYKPLRMPFKDDIDDFTNSPLDDKDDTAEGETEGKLKGNESHIYIECTHRTGSLI